MTRHRKPIRMSGMLSTRTYPDRVALTFDTVTGLSTVLGREGRVILTMDDIAGILMSVPASVLEPEDMKPLRQITDRLKESNS